MVSPTRKNMQFIDYVPTKSLPFQQARDAPEDSSLHFPDAAKPIDREPAKKQEEDSDSDFFKVKQYVKKRSLSNSDAFNAKDEPQLQPPMSIGSAEAKLKKGADMSEPKTSETKSNTDSNPTSTSITMKPKAGDNVLKVTKKQSQVIEQPFVSHQANMSVK